MKNVEVIWINIEEMIVYTTQGATLLQDKKELDSMLVQTKRDIANRPNVLDRFEHWEISGNDLRMISKILMSRTKNGKEKSLVKEYVENLLKE